MTRSLHNTSLQIIHPVYCGLDVQKNKISTWLTADKKENADNVRTDKTSSLMAVFHFSNIFNTPASPGCSNRWINTTTGSL